MHVMAMKMVSTRQRVLSGLFLLLAPLWCGAAEKVTVQALFGSKAIVLIDGQRRVLESGGREIDGVKLIATDTRAETAEVEVGGERRTLRLGTVMSAFTSAGKGKVTLYPEGSHYRTAGFINGSPVSFLVDTGATNIAMNSNIARQLGIDYQRVGKPQVAQTASGLVRTYTVKLQSVQVGDITLHNVDAGIIEGSFPTETLLGMSFLGQLDMKREADRFELIQR